MLAPVLLTGCTVATSPDRTTTSEATAPTESAASEAQGASSATPDASDEEAVTSVAPPPAAVPGPEAAALALAPEDTAYLTVTDWSAIKDRLGAGDLTSESIQTDTLEFWRSVGSSTVLLTDGALREENSRLRLRYAVTQDDALWEVRWAGEDGRADGAGLALRLRDDLDLGGLERAVAEEVPGVAGASVLPNQHLLLRGEADGVGLAGDQDILSPLLDGTAETRLVVPGCLSWPTALGVDATVEEQEAVVDAAAVEDLRSPHAWGLSFTGREATLTVVHGEGVTPEQAEADAAVRVELAEGWPTTESVGWADALGLPPQLEGEGYVLTESAGRAVTSIGYRVVNPTAAATVALSGLVPGAVCSEVDWLAEPTGL